MHGRYRLRKRQSLDGGAAWAQFKENLPPVPVDDIAIHRRDGDAILATHGRGIYIIDDLSPLRALTAEAMNKDVTMLPSRSFSVSEDAPTAVTRPRS